MGIVIDRNVAFRRWVHHLRISFFDHLDLPTWSAEHPYANPLRRIRLGIPQPADKPHSDPISWLERGIQPQDFPWIDLDTSFQWRAFREMAELLRDRGNRLFVLVGPFNEHMLTGPSRQRYEAMKREVEAWLSAEKIPHYVPAPLPSDEYADASHPLAVGYARLASQMAATEAFQQWLTPP
jgi:hypothetical protein